MPVYPDLLAESGGYFVSLPDLAATFLEVGGVTVPESMTARSLLPLFTSDVEGRIDPTRDHVLTGRERHTPAQDKAKPRPTAVR